MTATAVGAATSTEEAGAAVQDRTLLFGVTFAALAGVVLRVHEAVTAPPINDAAVYAESARRFSYLAFWQASFREPAWIAVLKPFAAVFGYTATGPQVLSCVVGIAGLLIGSFAVWRISPLVAPLVVALLAFNGHLIADAGYGGREAVGVLITATAVCVAVVRPSWLPVVASVALGVRWELGTALWVASVVIFAAGHIGWRPVARGLIVAGVLVGPFVFNNWRTYGDPMFHSDVHATYYRNVEQDGYGPVHVIPVEERVVPGLTNQRFRGPLISWSGYVKSLGPRETMAREADAVTAVPQDAVDLGAWSVVPCLLALCGLWRARRQAVAQVCAVILVIGIAGYGFVMPFFDGRLAGSLAVPVLVLAVFAVPATRSSSS